jgi:adenylosuccinate synthase
MPSYKQMDIDLEKERRLPIGTTGRGIGVTYSQKAQREGIRVCDLGDDNFLQNLTKEELEFLAPFIDRIKVMMIDLASFMDEYSSKKVLQDTQQLQVLLLEVVLARFQLIWYLEFSKLIQPELEMVRSPVNS